jgi:hypothetical protein
MLRMVLVSALASVLVLGCKFGSDAKIQAADRPLAVGSYSSVEIVDDSFSMTPAHATRLAAVILGDSKVARLPAPEELLPGFSIYSHSNATFIQALSPGKTSLKIDADFDDGSHRSVTATLTVEAIQAVSITPDCDDRVDAPMVAIAGTNFGFKVGLLNGSRPLAGYLPGAVWGEAVTCAPSSSQEIMDSTYCAWAAPAEGGTVTLSAGLPLTSSKQISTYAPGDVTEIGFDLSAGSTTVGTTRNGGGSFPSYVKLAGGRPCRSLPIQVKTQTPNVCAGPAGEDAWTTSDPKRLVAYTSLAEGECGLALGAVGASTFPTLVQLSTRVASDFTAAHTAEPNSPCASEGATACLSSFAAVESCNGKAWGSPSPCPRNQACEVLPQGNEGCSRTTGCARCR